MQVDSEWWKTCFDDIYLLTDARSVCDPEITKREVDVVCTLLELHPGERILDLCGGQGRHSIELLVRGYTSCTLLDYSRYLIEDAARTARGMGKDLRCVQADARCTGLSSASFDHVLILGNSLGYGGEPDFDLRILDEARRLLRRGGDILVDVVDGSSLEHTFNPHAWHEIGDDIIVCRHREIAGGRVNAREIVLDKNKGLLRDHTYSIKIYRAPQLKDLLQRSGFSDVRIHTRHTPHGKSGDYGCMKNRMIGIGYRGGDGQERV
jgi:D-alanine-D-alanine ligase